MQQIENNRPASIQAKEGGYSGAIILNSDGYVAEGAGCKDVRPITLLNTYVYNQKSGILYKRH